MSEAPLTSEDIFLQYCQAKPDKSTEFINDYILYCLDISNPFDSDAYSSVRQYIFDLMVAFDKYMSFFIYYLSLHEESYTKKTFTQMINSEFQLNNETLSDFFYGIMLSNLDKILMLRNKNRESEEKEKELNSNNDEKSRKKMDNDNKLKEKTIIIQDKKKPLSKTLIKSKSLSKPMLNRNKHFSVAERLMPTKTMMNTRIDSPPINKLAMKKNTNSNVQEGQTEKIKKQFLIKFQAKVKKIIDYFDRNNIHFDSNEDNPKTLLMQLQNTNDINEKNRIIDKIEEVIENYSSLLSQSNRISKNTE